MLIPVARCGVLFKVILQYNVLFLFLGGIFVRLQLEFRTFRSDPVKCVLASSLIEKIGFRRKHMYFSLVNKHGGSVWCLLDSNSSAIAVFVVFLRV